MAKIDVYHRAFLNYREDTKNVCIEDILIELIKHDVSKEKIAEIKEISVEEVLKITTNNAKELFKL